jgi:hypothetical protein
LDTGLVLVPSKCEQRYGRGVDVCRVSHPERRSVARVPPTAWAHSLKQHVHTDLDALAEFGASAQTMLPSLLKSDDATAAESCWIESNLTLWSTVLSFFSRQGHIDKSTNSFWTKGRHI